MVYLLDDQIQVIEQDPCGMYQIYFYVNLFRPMENSKIINDKKLNEKTMEKLLNQMFTLDRQRNENRIERFAKENDISRS